VEGSDLVRFEFCEAGGGGYGAEDAGEVVYIEYFFLGVGD